MGTSESNRARRFALPDLADERAGESIEAFLHGRRGKARKPATTPQTGVVGHPQTGAAVALRSMPGRLEWNAAIEREIARSTRYERPAAVAVLEIRPLRPSATMDSWLRVHAAPLGQVLLRGSRATDVVARVANTRFQVLLPETTAEAAKDFVERIVGECHEQLREVGAPLKVAASVAASSPDVPLREAVNQALSSIEAA
jgi:GGDEF domain-containing protein